MSATDPTDRAFKQYADLERQALKWRAERDKAIAEGDALATRCNTAEREGDAARKQIERALFILRASSLSGQQARARALTILTEGQET